MGKNQASHYTLFSSILFLIKLLSIGVSWYIEDSDEEKNRTSARVN
jgi:hypothetical protein